MFQCENVGPEGPDLPIFQEKLKKKLDFNEFPFLKRVYCMTEATENIHSTGGQFETSELDHPQTHASMMVSA